MSARPAGGGSGPVALGVGAAVERARGLLGRRRALLGITGPPGAGKSTLAAAIVGELGARAVVVPMDGFHLADRSLEALGLLGFKGRLDTFDAWGYLELLRRLRRETARGVYAPGFERELEQPIAASILVPSESRLVVTEGNYLLLDDEPWPRIAAELDEIWYCELDPSLRRERLVARHIRFGKPAAAAIAWVDTVDEPNARLVMGRRSKADAIVLMAEPEDRPAPGR
jgi:pantothenate kinase